MQRPKLHLAEDLLSRFRSKEDLYRYMTCLLYTSDAADE